MAISRDVTLGTRVALWLELSGVLAHLGSSLCFGISSGGIQPIAGVSKRAVPTGKRAF